MYVELTLHTDVVRLVDNLIYNIDINQKWPNEITFEGTGRIRPVLFTRTLYSPYKLKRIIALTM